MSKPSDDYNNVNPKNGTAAYEGNIVEQQKTAIESQ